MLLLSLLAGCAQMLALLSTDEVIDATCAGRDTVVIDGRDICAEFESTGRVRCDVGYVIILDGKQVCPNGQDY